MSKRRNDALGIAVASSIEMQAVNPGNGASIASRRLVVDGNSLAAMMLCSEQMYHLTEAEARAHIGERVRDGMKCQRAGHGWKVLLLFPAVMLAGILYLSFGRIILPVLAIALALWVALKHLKNVRAAGFCG